jgi:glyoxylase-like metal-dependent hydrolase (beta-lactamase superfamily II)
MTVKPFQILRRDLLLGAAALGASALGGISLSRAAAPPLGTQVPSWYRFKIGDFEATVVSDGPLPLGDPTTSFQGLPPEQLKKMLADNFLPTDNAVLEQNALVVNTGRNLILFDTGMGTDQTYGPTTGKLLANLKAAGIDPAQIDAVVITHAHIDHCWALMSDDGRQNFPNARIFITKSDFDFWTDESKMAQGGFMKPFIVGARKHLLPVRDKTTFVEDGKEVLPGVTAIASPGHTVGHTCYVVSSGNQSLMFTGDLCHHQVLLLQTPRLEFAYDTDPKQSAMTRVRVLDMLASQRMPIVSYHFPFPGVGHVAKAGDGFAWHPSPMRTVL